MFLSVLLRSTVKRTVELVRQKGDWPAVSARGYTVLAAICSPTSGDAEHEVRGCGSFKLTKRCQSLKSPTCPAGI